MMRRVKRAVAGLAVAALAAGAVSLVSVGAAAAAEREVDGFQYLFDDQDPAAGAFLHKYLGPGGAVRIPAEVTIDGVAYPVTTIGGGAFYSMGLTSVDIPETVTVIGAGAFRANSLSTVTLPPGLTDIPASAFGENRISSIVLPDSITTIGEFAFDQNSLSSITFGPNVRSIGHRAFRYNPDLTEVVFTGPTPVITARGDGGSFGADDDLIVYYPWRFGVPGGYESPTWADYPAQPEVTVTFAAAGDGPDPAAQRVRPGAATVRPADPVRAGLVFGGWATSATGEDDFDFAATPATDVTAHARWTAAPASFFGSLGSIGSLFSS